MINIWVKYFERCDWPASYQVNVLMSGTEIDRNSTYSDKSKTDFSIL